MTVMNVLRRLAASRISTAGSAALTATAVGRRPHRLLGLHGGRGRSDGKLDIVALFYLMQYLAEQIGGTHVQVTSLTQPGQEPHDLEISARQTARLQSADAVVYLEEPAAGRRRRRGAVRGQDQDRRRVADDPGEARQRGRRHAASHDTSKSEESGSADPHIWLDPVKYGQVAEGVAKALKS